MNQIRETTAIDFEYEVVARRAGDPARLIADASRIEKIMGWKAKHSLVEIIDSAWKALS
jgi:UDP-glucose 4-epimerase